MQRIRHRVPLAIGVLVLGVLWSATAPAVASEQAAQIIVTAVGNGTAATAGDGSKATAASVNNRWGLAIDSKYNLYVAQLQGAVVRKVTPDGTISTYAGTGTAGSSGDGGAATSATLSGPYGVAVRLTLTILGRRRRIH